MVGLAGEIQVETTVGGTATALPGRMMLKRSWEAETTYTVMLPRALGCCVVANVRDHT